MQTRRPIHPLAGGAAALCAALIAAPGQAAADRIVRGVVVTREASEIYLDIGRERGATDGAPVRLRRPIRLRHPVSGAWVSDELPLAESRLTRVGDSLSMARLGADLYARIRVGDVAEVLVAESAPEPARRPGRAPAPAPPVTDRDTAEVLAVWDATAGAALDVRIAAWERYLAGHPSSRYAASVRSDLDLLRDLRRRRPTPGVEDAVVMEGVAHDAPARADGGQPLELAFALRDPGRVLAAWLHYRPLGDPTYRRVALRPDGDGYLRGELPARALAAPGIEYFAEVATSDGRVGAAVGRPAAPVSVAIERPSGRLFDERRHRSRVSLTTTYLDFATFDRRGSGDDHRDRFLLNEADFLYRLKFGLLHGIRMGMGAINGRGGFADRVDPEKAGFHYGFTEAELRGGPTRAVLARVIAGLGREGLGFGLEGRLRLGAEEGSNLTFALSSLEEIGFLSEVRMQWGALEEVPLGFAVAVTDQPNRGDLGLRLSTDVGWRALPWFQPTVRLSYQGRSVEHSGVGVGGGLVFDW
jgi:hypothetical protein